MPFIKKEKERERKEERWKERKLKEEKILRKERNEKKREENKKSKKSEKEFGKEEKEKEKFEKTKQLIKKILKKYETPIIAPSENEWESWQTFNPGVALINEKIHFLYRALGKDWISRFGYANSEDGFYIKERLPYPVYEVEINNKNFRFSFSGGGFGGVEDPRLTYIEEDGKLYVTFTLFDDGIQVALTSINVDDFLNKNWKWENTRIISNPKEIHKNWAIFPEKINGKYAIIHSISPKILITYLDSLDFNGYIESYYNGYNCEWATWEKYVRGIGAPPIKIKDGWLLLYHATDELGKYKIGAMVLDAKDPTKIKYKCNAPIIEPENYYEVTGVKPNIVYSTGATIKDNTLLIYYGASDTYICIAYAPLDKFLSLLKEGKPKIYSKILKKKK